MTKQCNKCSKIKETKDFSKRSRAKDGLYHQCKECKNLLKRQDHQNNPHNLWARKQIGLTKEIYTQLLNKYNNKCAICEKAPIKKALAVDHCHETGKIRGLLCDNCNRAIGYLKDDHNLINKAASYVAEYKNK